MPTLSRDTIEWAIEHLSRYPDTDIFPKAFEFDALSHCSEDLLRKLSNQDICQWNTRPFRKCLVPKQRYGFRIATQLDPLDSLMYLCLILELGEYIESARMPIARNISFSNRYTRDDTDFLLFNRNVGYREFDNHSSELCNQYDYVVLTDIADFYHRIYVHPLENALRSAAPNLPSHVTAILSLIKGWNHNVSYGIPVGNNPSRLLAELVITDVDRVLISEGIEFARYVDDYRIFCQSRSDAYRSLSYLSRSLYDMHGLTLQSQKTNILTKDEFMQQFIETEERRELDSLTEHFDDILYQLGIHNPYNIVIYGDLPPDLQARIDNLNLTGLLEVTLRDNEFDMRVARFIINRLGWFRNQDALDLIMGQIEALHPIFAEVITYLDNISGELEPESLNEIGSVLLNLIEGSVVSQLEYNRTLIMRLFADSIKWGNSERLPHYYSLARDDWMRRKILLANGKAGHDYWLRAKKSQSEDMSRWEKRGFLYAASCLPADERRHWYRAIRSRLDDLEKYIIDWSSSFPINQ